VLNRDRTRHKPLLTLILVAAIVIRIPIALYMGDQVTVLPGIQDQVSYDALARSLLAERGYCFTENWYPFTPADTPTAHWSFTYPLYLAGMYLLTGYHPLAAPLFQGSWIVDLFAGLPVLSWPAPRYRLPVDAVLMVFAGLALYELARQIIQRRHGLSLSQGKSS